MPSLFTLSILIFFLIPGKAFNCRQGEDQFPEENVCILAVNEPMFYNDAARHCASLGGWTIQIRNSYENAYLLAALQTELNGATPYIGVERSSNNTWRYSDGSPLTYQNWALGEPSDSSNSSLCAVIDPQSGRWLSAECGFVRPFYCFFDGDGFQCPDGWIYSNQTDYCYYLQNFTYPDSVHWQVYNFSTAEANCQRMNSHLASIHSKAENEFVYGLINSSVKNERSAAPNRHPCDLQWTWIGLTGNGRLRDGTWTDGSAVDFTGTTLFTGAGYHWLMTNDGSCFGSKWGHTGSSPSYARFVCKQPSAGRSRRESKN